MRKSSRANRSLRTTLVFVFLAVVAYLLLANRWTRSIERDSLTATQSNREIVQEGQAKELKEVDIPDVEAFDEDVEDQLDVPRATRKQEVEVLLGFEPILPVARTQLTATSPSFVLDPETEKKTDAELVEGVKERGFEELKEEDGLIVAPAKVLEDTVGALRRAVGYLANNTALVNIDAFIYLAIAEGRIRLLFRKLTGHKGQPVKGMTPATVDDLYAILESVKRTLDSADDVLRASNAFNEKLRPLYSHQLWTFPIDRKYFDMLDQPLPGDEQQATPNVLECISQLIGSGAGSACSVDDECWSSMTRNGMTGFGAVQQVLFILIGEAFHCENVMNLKAFSNNMLAYTAYLGRFCSGIYKELTDQLANKMSEKLIFEQVFMCGLAGYMEFYRPEVLVILTSSQKSTGCYEEQTLSKMIMQVIKQSEGDCAISMTASAIGALIGYITLSIENFNSY